MPNAFPIRIDKVSIELSGENIRLRWSHESRRYSLSLGRLSQQSLNAAKSKAHEISSDIYRGVFDPSRYSPQPSTQQPEQSLIKLWHLYYQAKLNSGLKEKTKDWLANIDRIAHKLGTRLTFNGFLVKDELLEITTVNQTRITLKALSSCCQYGIKRNLIFSNPFQGVWEELPDKQPTKPYCFTSDQISKITNNFSTHPQYSYYTDLVIFWLYTGCRPSEALGVTWGDVAADFSTITFRGSPQFIKGKGVIWSEGSKNYKKGSRRPQSQARTVPLGQKLIATLEQRKPAIANKSQLVFPNYAGGYILYGNFCKRAWATCVRSLPSMEQTTPYNCRDTFITQQLIKGVPIAIIAAWCDNSPSMIESRYADYLMLGSIKPADF